MKATSSTRSNTKVQYAPKRWHSKTGLASGELFTCARPGRSLGRKAKVSDSEVHDWVGNLPSRQKITIISLLGLRKNGRSEFSYYTFRGGDDKSQRPSDSTFQEWLDSNFPRGRFVVVERPTEDYKPIPSDKLAALALEVRLFLDKGETVVVMDSGGDKRSGKVCRYMGFCEHKTGRGEPRSAAEPDTCSPRSIRR
jgi:hypothetical protein